MKLLTFITALTLLFSSHSFAKSVVGKVLFCENKDKFEFTVGYVFLDEENVERVFIHKLEVYSLKLRYETSLRQIKIGIERGSNTYIYSIDRKTLIGEFIVRIKDRVYPPSIRKCSVQNSKEELVNLMRKGIQKILNNNQL